MKEKIYNMVYEVEGSQWWYRVRRQLVKDLISKYANKTTTILDIGCGPGLLLSELQNNGREIFGVDLSPIALEFCKKRGLKNVSLADAGALPFSDNTFDVVLLLDMLEHVQDDSGVLREARRVLKSEGIVIIFVPCFNFLWTKNDEISHHYRRYTLPELTNKISSNFTILRKTYFNFFLFPLIFLLTVVMNLLRVKLIAGKKLNNKITDSIWHVIFKQELSFLKFLSFPFGVSAFIVAKK